MKNKETFTREEDKATKKAIEDLNKSRILAAHLAELIYSQDETTQQKIMAVGILFSSMCVLHEVPPERIAELLEYCLNMAEGFFEEVGKMQ